MKNKLKTYKIYLLLICLITLKLNAQVNLVSNPSFESTVNCPNSDGQINFASSWSSPSLATPD